MESKRKVPEAHKALPAITKAHKALPVNAFTAGCPANEAATEAHNITVFKESELAGLFDGFCTSTSGSNATSPKGRKHIKLS
jgi:hypothetical protein